MVQIINAGGPQVKLLVFSEHVLQSQIQLQIKPDVMLIFLVVCMLEQVFVLLKEIVHHILPMEFCKLIK